jgi:hypothetical protein
MTTIGFSQACAPLEGVEASSAGLSARRLQARKVLTGFGSYRISPMRCPCRYFFPTSASITTFLFWNSITMSEPPKRK